MARKKVEENTLSAKPQGKATLPESPATGSDPWERIKIEPTPKGYESFVGTRDDLTAAGICTEEQFPLPPRRTISYRCNLGNWTTSKVKGGYRHQVEGREAMAKRRTMESMKEEIEAAVREFARQLARAVYSAKPQAVGPKILPNDPRFHMTEDSYQKLWWAANHLYQTASGVEISPDSPAFNGVQKPTPRNRPTLTLISRAKPTK